MASTVQSQARPAEMQTVKQVNPIRAAFTVTINEMIKGLWIIWDYKFNLLMQLTSITFVFIGIMFFRGNGALQQDQLIPALVGFLITFFAIDAISTMSWTLMNEAQSGTLEQMYMTPVSTGLVLMGRAFSTIVSSTIQIVIVGFALTLLLGVGIPLSIEGIPVIAVTLLGLFGFSYIIGGLTLIFKQVGPLANLVSNMLLIFNGALLPLELLPEGISKVLNFIPSAQGIIVARKVMIDGLSLADVWADGSLPTLIVYSVAFLLFGWAIYKWCETVARRQGTLGHY